MKNLIKREQSKPVCFAESENSRTKFKRLIVCLMAMMGVPAGSSAVFQE